MRNIELDAKLKQEQNNNISNNENEYIEKLLWGN